MTPQPTAFGDALKGWRLRRHMSQLELALDANVSARHISFLETGRSRPSREMVLQLAATMGLPLRASNELLGHAGFTRAFAETGLDAATLGPVRRALDHMLMSHMPYPAIICDRHWNLIDANPAARALLAPLQSAEGPANMIQMIASNPVARELLVNWDEVVHDLTGRLRLEAARSGGDPILEDLLRLVRHDPSKTDRELATSDHAARRAFTPVMLRHGEGVLSLLSLLAEFGTPRDITIGDLRIELFFPADTATEQFFRVAFNDQK